MNDLLPLVELTALDIAEFDTFAPSIAEKTAWIKAAIRAGTLISIAEPVRNYSFLDGKTLPSEVLLAIELKKSVIAAKLAASNARQGAVKGGAPKSRTAVQHRQQEKAAPAQKNADATRLKMSPRAHIKLLDR